MSRLCIKNLPKSCDEARLREHLSTQGEITDTKIVRTKDGQSRQFGFVGFRTDAEAAAALRYFNRTFMDTSRISIEYAKKFGSEELGRPWSKYSEGSSRHKSSAANGSGARQGGQQAAWGAGVSGAMQRKGRQAAAEDEDPELAEFLSVMQPRRQGALWANDDLLPGGRAAQQAQPARTAVATTAVDGGVEFDDGGGSGSDEEYGELPARAAATGVAVLASGADCDAGSDRGAGAGRDAVVADAAVSDLDYLRARMRANFSDDDEDDGDGAGTHGDASDASKASDASDASDVSNRNASVGGASDAHGDGDGGREEPEPSGGSASDSGVAAGSEDAASDHSSDSHEEPSVAATRAGAAAVEGGEGGVADTGRLFVRNLPYRASEEDLRELFGRHGELAEMHLVVDKATKRSRGLAYVLFSVPEDAVAAMQALDMTHFQGRLLHILPAHKPPERRDAACAAPPRPGGSAFKAEREAGRKADAGNRAAWNSLFMRQDTVAEAIAAHYGMSKAQLLDHEAEDLPVRMALGETQVIAATKKALGEAGVAVQLLERAASAAGAGTAAPPLPRSARVLLVKNLPFAAEQSELGALFGGYGPLARLLLPPTRTLALVEFLEAQDARRAFKGLAYRRYKHVPLYLEWAPEGIFEAPPPDAPAETAMAVAPAAGRGVDAGVGGLRHGDSALAQGLVDAEADEAESATLYVKNLDWGTDDTKLHKHFERAAKAAGGALRSARVARKKGPDGGQLSMGFGFVECSSDAVAKALLKQLQGSSLDGHKLQLQLSGRRALAAGGAAAAAQASGKPLGSKLVVRNIAFEATRKEVLSLFAPLGAVRSCRLPRKFDGTPRGFAFVDFATPQEARNAMDTLAGTHLYGRRLVLEWAAADEEGLDELQAKTAAQLAKRAAAEGGGAAKRLKRRKL